MGGGTVLMFRYRHRLSKDIDILCLIHSTWAVVTPRLSDTAADMTEDYTEQPGMFVKLQFRSGEVDFASRPICWMTPGKLGFGDRAVKVETAAEIIAKRCITVATALLRATCLIWHW